MGIRLTITDGEGQRRQLDLDQLKLVVGRSQDCELVISDPRASRRHCQLLRTPQGLVLEDLGSANGTVLGGQPVSRVLLQPGDEFRVGRVKVLFESMEESDGAPQAPDPFTTPAAGGTPGPVVAPASTSDVTPAEGDACGSGGIEVDGLEAIEGLDSLEDLLEDAPESAGGGAESGDGMLELAGPDGASEGVAVGGLDDEDAGDEEEYDEDDEDDELPRIRWFDGEEVGEELEIDELPFSIGRRSDNSLRIDDRRASGHHAQISREGADLIIEDLGSKNGMLVDGRKVERAVLTTGSRLVIGACVFEFVVPGSEPAARSATGLVTRTAGERDGGDDLALARVDVDEFFAADRAQQPLLVTALVAIICVVAYFSIDVARRLLVVEVVDPAPEENLVGGNWSFEETEPEGEDERATGVPGWKIEDPSLGGLRTGAKHAQFPGHRALQVTCAAPEGACAVRHESDITLGVDREFVLEGFVASEGAYFAGFMVEWMGVVGGESSVVGRTFSECAIGTDATLDVLDTVLAPAGATHARLSCVVFGSGGSGYFDRVSLTVVGEPDGGAPPATAAGVELTAGDGERDVRMRLGPDGTFEVATSRRRLFSRVWAALPPGRDPQLYGPALGGHTVETGDRGVLLVTSTVPNVPDQAWATVETALRAAATEITTEWRLSVGEESPGASSDPVVIYLASGDPETAVLALSGSGGSEAPLRSVKASGVDELVVGARRDRVSLVFSSPVSVDSRPHPVVGGQWLITARPAGGARLRLSIVPGSRRDREAAQTVLAEARKAFVDGRVADARRLVADVKRRFPDEERAIRQGEAALEQWKAEVRGVISSLEEARQELQRRPSPVIFSSVRERAATWQRRLTGTPEGRELDTWVARLESAWNEREATARSERIRGLLERAREHFTANRLGLAEMFARMVLESGEDGGMRRQAQSVLDRVETRRKTVVTTLMLR